MIARNRWLVMGWLVLGCSPGGADPAATEASAPGDGTGDSSGSASSGESADDTAGTDPTTAEPTSDDAATTDESSTDAPSSDAGSSTDADPCAVPDADDDGHDAVACGGPDCDDSDPETHPGATDFAVSYELVADVATPYVTIDVDDAGVAYVAYLYDTQLRVSDDSAGFWDYRDNGGGNRFDVHVDGDGAVQTAVVSGVLSPNVMVWWADIGAPFEYPDLANAGTPTEVRFLAVDDDGRPHMLWQQYDVPTLTYAVRDDDGWAVESFDTGLAYGAVLAVAGDGQPWVFYDVEAGPSVATLVDGTWQIEALDGGEVGYAAAVVAPDGSVHVARRSDVQQSVRYSTNASGTWTDQDVGDLGRAGFTAIAVADDGDVYIVAEDEPIQWEASLQLLTHTGGAWQQTQLRADVSAMRPAATIANGQLLVSHVDLTGYTVQLIRAELADGIDQDCDRTPW